MLLNPIPTTMGQHLYSPSRSNFEGCSPSGNDLHTPWGDTLEVLPVQK